MEQYRIWKNLNKDELMKRNIQVFATSVIRNEYLGYHVNNNNNDNNNNDIR